MKAVVLYVPTDVRIEEIEKPELENEGEIIIRVKASGICGSDLHLFKFGLFQNVGKAYNSGFLMGHEFSGDIVEIAGNVKGVNVGDRVVAVAKGAQAEYVKVACRGAWSVLPISPDISYEEAATTEPLATSLHAANLALRSQAREHWLLKEASGMENRRTAVVFGAGIIGLGVLQILKATTKDKAVVVDISDRRLDMAKRLGADVTINSSKEDPVEKMMEMTGKMDLRYASASSSGVDTVFDCVGAPRELKGVAPLRQAITMVKPNGKIVAVAFFEKPLEIEVTDIVAKNVSLHGALEWSRNEFIQAFELIRSGKINRKPLISHEFPLDSAAEAYETQANTDETVKIMIKP